MPKSVHMFWEKQFVTHIEPIVDGVVSGEGGGPAGRARGRGVELVEGDSPFAEGLEASGVDDAVVVHPGHVGVA